jgi:YD repeat-containing protein
LSLITPPVVTTSYDPANRPTTDTGGGTYTSDFDGRLTAMPGQTMTSDSLGRLTGVTIGGATSAYTYDPLDRLGTVTRSGAVQRFR